MVGVLSDRKAVASLARLAGPLVRAADSLVGEKVAMLVEVEFTGKFPLLRFLFVFEHFFSFQVLASRRSFESV
jgi:hypothetical protein